MFNDVAIILINKFGIEGEVTTPSTLGLSLEVGFVDHISNVAKGMILYHNGHTMGTDYIMDVNTITANTHIITQC